MDVASDGNDAVSSTTSDGFRGDSTDVYTDDGITSFTTNAKVIVDLNAFQQPATISFVLDTTDSTSSSGVVKFFNTESNETVLEKVCECY